MTRGQGAVAEGALAEGEELGKYRVDRVIGRGGAGEVYAATNLATGRAVALKILKNPLAGDDERRRFLREARASTAIDHPNVIDVLDVFEHERMPVMVMELLRGETLADKMRREGALPLKQAAALLLPVAEALVAAHDKGIVHRDLKPSNIFLVEAGDAVQPKVLDFGIAKILDPDLAASDTAAAETKTGSILGTPHYMSFEQAMSDRTVDHRADVWAFTVILYEAIAGERPLAFESLGQMYATMLNREVPRPTQTLVGLPEDLGRAMDAGLVKERDARLGSLEPFVAALRRVTTMASPPTIVRASAPAELTGTRPTWWLAVAAATAVAVGIVGWQLTSADATASSEPTSTAAATVDVVVPAERAADTVEASAVADTPEPEAPGPSAAPPPAAPPSPAALAKPTVAPAEPAPPPSATPAEPAPPEASAKKSGLATATPY